MSVFHASGPLLIVVSDFHLLDAPPDFTLPGFHINPQTVFTLYPPRPEYKISDFLVHFHFHLAMQAVIANFPIFVGLIRYCSQTSPSPLIKITKRNHSDQIKNKLQHTYMSTCLPGELQLLDTLNKCLWGSCSLC